MTASRRTVSRLLVASTALIGLVATGAVASAPASAATDPGTLLGQGGSFAEPVLSKILADDAPNVAPVLASYFQTDNTAGINAFIGSSPDNFGADFALSERPLTAAEAATSIANGRTFAYVPIESTPVALATLVPTAAWSLGGASSIDSSGFCLHPPMTAALLGEIFGAATPPLDHWNDPRITCPEPGGAGTTADGLPVALWANLDPSQANYATMALLDSTPGSKADFQAGLNGTGSLTTNTTPSQLWPYAQNTIPGGDQPLIGKLLDINAETNTPSTNASYWQLGSITPMSSVWTGSPLGVPWNLATSGIQNAQGAFVAPSAAAAAAAAAHTTVAATSDPATNNLVTFDASTTDATAYNNYMMAESYLVVPTKGLSAAKANALAQIIRFAVGPTGQADITRFGAAPATAAMQAADLKVAAELNASAVAATNPNNTTGSTTTTTAAGGAGAAGSTGSGSTGTDTSSTGSSATGTDTSGGLAFTGSANLGAWIATGVSLFVVGEFVRRRLKRQEVRS